MKPISMALLSALIWLFSQAAFAQQTNSNFDLNECLKYALEHSVTIKNSLLSQSSAEARVQEIKSIGLPQANANINLTSNLLVPRSFIPAEFSGGPPGTFQAVAFQPQYTGQAGVDVSQLVFDGAYFLGLKAASVFTKISEKTVVMDKITVVENVSKAYYTVLINQERLKLLQKNYSRMDSLYYQTKMLFQNGFAEKLDVSRLEVSLNNLKAEIQKFERIQNLTLAMLKFQMSMPESENLTLKGELALPAQSSAPDNADPTKRIEYQILQTQAELEALNVRNYKVQYYPTVRASLGLGANSGSNDLGEFFKFGTNWFGNSTFAIGVSIPIFDGFKKKSQIAQAKFALQKTQNTISDFTRIMEFQLKQAALSFQNATETMKAQKQNVELAEEVYRVTRIKFKEGVGTKLELLDAETSLKESETNYLNALYDAIIAHVDVCKANGTLLETAQ